MSALARQLTRPIPEQQQQLAKALGWFSIGLGAAEFLFPNLFARLIGVKRHPRLFRFLGARELSSGIGILKESKYPAWVQSRVCGDVMDLGLIALAFTSGKTKTGRLATAAAAVAGVTALDIVCAEELTRTRKAGGHNGAPEGKIRTQRSITINRSPEELYRFWRNFENLPQVMYHIESVHSDSDGRSHWVAKGPGGKKIEWNSNVTEDRPNELIAWATLPGSEINHKGSVRFEPATGRRGTVVRAEMEYQLPGGLLGAAFAKLLRREPGQLLEDSLRYFRQLMETGVISTTVGQPAGRSLGTSRKFDLPTPGSQPQTKLQFQS